LLSKIYYKTILFSFSAVQEVEKMRVELAQKEELLTRTRDKVSMWTNSLQDLETKQTRLQLADMLPQRPVSLDAYSQLDTSRT